MKPTTLEQIPDMAALREAILEHVTYSMGALPEELTSHEMFEAVALGVRDLLVDRMLDTKRRYGGAEAKRLYYLSVEFLIGRSLTNNLLNLGMLETCRELLREMNLDPNDIEQSEVDAALGNGGLGRLAACFLDSLATLGMPGFGYGINYEYGLFRQEIKNGQQVERPDNWRTYPSPWQIERPQEAVLVPVYGRVEHATDRTGGYNPMWLDWRVVIGVPHDMLIAGYGGKTVNYLRLYSARASQEFDVTIFNDGDYFHAVEQRVQSETISKMLYPSDSQAAGRELRLVQEYFMVACAMRDIVRRHLRDEISFDSFPDKVAIQLNDTHPSLAVAELMRILIDENNLEWDKAWEITTGTFGYTNHTLMPEALERWPVQLLERVIPRHLQIIYEINRRLLESVARRWPGDTGRLERMSLIEENNVKQVRMANLAIVGSHAVNGVAKVHSELVKTKLVPDFYELWPEKFQNKTNGITPRRWLALANPGLAKLITDSIGDQWITDLDQLRALEPYRNDAGFCANFLAVKRENKQRLANSIADLCGVKTSPDSLFDIQVKRIHEYKRQLLNVLHIVDEYLSLVDDQGTLPQPRTYVFAGKAAPGYVAAKQIIRLINDVAQIINNDPRSRDWIKVAFVPDYRVTLAEIIIPAADLSEQISTAGTEASGTSNMKFALNGALTMATLDGANIEIREAVGPENIFIFGLTVEQAQATLAKGYKPRDVFVRSARAQRILQAFRDNRFCPRAPGRHDWVYTKLLADGESYLHLADLESYLQTHKEAEQLYRDRNAWAAKAILNVARMGRFSSDRTIREYAKDIWGLKSVQ